MKLKLDAMKGFVGQFKKEIVKYSPQILTVAGTAGLLYSGVKAAKETPKAMEILKKLEEEKEDEEIALKEKVKSVAPVYICPIAISAVSVLCIFAANKITMNRLMSLTTAYRMAKTVIADNDEKTKEVLTNQQNDKLNAAIAKKKTDDFEYRVNEVIETGQGDVLCLDGYTGRYFKSNAEKIKAVENYLNKEMINGLGTHVSLNELWVELGLPERTVGDYVGWSLENGLLELKLSAVLLDSGEPCIVMDYIAYPLSFWEYE